MEQARQLECVYEVVNVPAVLMWAVHPNDLCGVVVESNILPLQEARGGGLGTKA